MPNLMLKLARPNPLNIQNTLDGEQPFGGRLTNHHLEGYLRVSDFSSLGLSNKPIVPFILKAGTGCRNDIVAGQVLS